MVEVGLVEEDACLGEGSGFVYTCLGSALERKIF